MPYRMSTNPKFLETYILDKNFPANGSEPRPPPSSRPAPLHDAGTLAHLPTELLHAVIDRLDLRSVANLSYTNRYVHALTTSQPSFAAMRTHAVRIVYYILSTDAGRFSLLADAYAGLTTISCAKCARVAGYYDILAGTRICAACLRASQSDHKSMHPLRYSTALGAYALPPKAMDAVPQVRSMRGRPLPHAFGDDESVIMFRCADATAAALRFHGSAAAMHDAAFKHRMVAHGTSAEEETRMSACRVCYAQHRAYYKDRVQTDNALYWLSIVRLPYWNRTTGATERSFYCPGCVGFGFSEEPWFRKKFFAANYEEHLRLLGPVLVSWKDKHNVFQGATTDPEALRAVSRDYLNEADTLDARQVEDLSRLSELDS